MFLCGHNVRCRYYVFPPQQVEIKITLMFSVWNRKASLITLKASQWSRKKWKVVFVLTSVFMLLLCFTMFVIYFHGKLSDAKQLCDKSG